MYAMLVCRFVFVRIEVPNVCYACVRVLRVCVLRAYMCVMLVCVCFVSVHIKGQMHVMLVFVGRTECQVSVCVLVWAH